MSAFLKGLVGCDPSCSADANLQHTLHWFEGYRAYVCLHAGPDAEVCPYSKENARWASWMAGNAQAKLDMRESESETDEH